MYLSQFSTVNRLAAYGELFLKHTKLSKALRKLECNIVPVGFPLQFDLNLESHRHFSPFASEVFWLDEFTDAICASRYLLQDLQCGSDRCLACAVFPNQ